MTHHATAFVIDHKNAVSLCAAARQSLQQKRFSLAEEQLCAALKLRPSCALAYKLLGDLFAEQNKKADADRFYRNDFPDGYLGTIPASVSAADSAQYVRHQVHAPENVNAPEPGKIAASAAFAPTRLTSDECFVDSIQNGSLWHDDLNLVVKDSGGVELQQHTVGCPVLVELMQRHHEPRKIHGRAIVIGAKGAHNFYHWTTDIIPKLLLLEASGYVIQSSDYIVVSRADADFALQLLKCFGISADQIVQTETSSPYIEADELVVPFLNNKMGYTMGQWLPAALRNKMGVDKPVNGNRKLFINRDPAASAGRTLKNSSVAEAFFEDCGFEVMYPEKLTVVEQAQLFSSASVIAGVHGAGFANIVYCSPGTKIIEFYGAHIAPCYWLISALAGYDYYQHPCEVAADHNKNKHAAGLLLPLNEVLDLLEYAGAA